MIFSSNLQRCYGLQVHVHRWILHTLQLIFYYSKTLESEKLLFWNCNPKPRHHHPQEMTQARKSQKIYTQNSQRSSTWTGRQDFMLDIFGSRRWRARVLCPKTPVVCLWSVLLISSYYHGHVSSDELNSILLVQCNPNNEVYEKNKHTNRNRQGLDLKGPWGLLPECVYYDEISKN